jgi:5-amino-6-(5-phosphoribosylamino)uracil reductase
LRVYSNTAMSADGKIGTFRHDHVAIGTDEDRRQMSRLRAQADAVVVGGKTFRNWPIPLVERAADRDLSAPRAGPMINAVLTRRGVADATGARFPSDRVDLRVYGPPELDRAAHERQLGAVVETTDSPGLAWVLGQLEREGCRSVLIEGGGDLIFAALADDLLDELYLTICPSVIGGRTAPTPADGPGFSADELRRLRLLDVRTVGDEVYLHYAVSRPARPGGGVVFVAAEEQR